jgi:hypothetical protein
MQSTAVDSNSLSLNKIQFLLVKFTLLNRTVYLRRGWANIKVSEHSTLTSLKLGFLFRPQCNRYMIYTNVIQVNKEIKCSTSCVVHY